MRAARCTRRPLPPPNEAERSLAEGEGFEPPEPFPVQWFSRPPPSTTRPSLRVEISPEFSGFSRTAALVPSMCHRKCHERDDTGRHDRTIVACRRDALPSVQKVASQRTRVLRGEQPRGSDGHWSAPWRTELRADRNPSTRPPWQRLGVVRRVAEQGAGFGASPTVARSSARFRWRILLPGRTRIGFPARGQRTCGQCISTAAEFRYVAEDHRGSHHVPGELRRSFPSVRRVRPLGEDGH